MLHMERIGIRELRQNASKYIARAKAGETIEITERGEPVAELVPKKRSARDRLLAEGKLRPGGGDLLAHGPPLPRKPGSRPLSEIVDELREERLR